ncbi:MAG: DUF2157 domain-containing protein [Sphingomonadaceae bacterium]
MALDRKLEAWLAAGVIDTPTADRIRAFETREKSGERPVLLWAIIGLGLLALVLGILLLVAANWDRIPHALKLGVHMALTITAAVLVWRATVQRRPRLREGGLFVLAGLVLGGITLQSQIYQLVGPIWRPLLTWLLLMTPAILLAGQTRLTGHGWAAMLLATTSTLAWDHQGESGLWLVVHGLWMASPVLLLLLSALPWFHRREFARALADTGLITMLAGASFAHFAWAEHIRLEDAAEWLARMVLPALCVAWLVVAGRRWKLVPQPLLLPLTVGPLVAVTLALCIPHGDSWPWRFAGFLIYVLMWGWIAWGASRAGWSLLFAVAVAAVALRLFIVYLELFGSLASTGLGLVIGGLLLIGLAVVWHRFIRTFGRAAS